MSSLKMANVEELIKNETHPEVLRELALFINAEAKKIAEENRSLREAAAKRDAKRQEWLTYAIEAQLSKLRRRYFERGRESLGTKGRDRRSEEEQLLLHAKGLVKEEPKLEKAKLPEEEHQFYASVGEVFQSAHERDPDLTMDVAEIEEISGFYETSSEITVTERIYTRIIHKRQKYRVKNKKTLKETIVTAPGPLKLLPGCRYSVDFALSVVAAKYLNHLPFERQRRDMKRQGLDIPVMTMFRLSEQVAVHLEGVCEDIREDIFTAPLAVHLDETRWPILSNHDDDGQMWILSNQAGSYYRFEPTRSGQIADELLKTYEGPVLTDKYSGYLHFRAKPKLTWGLCWGHARREFFDLKTAYPAETTRIIAAIDDLFKIERRARTWEELKSLRKSQSKQKVTEIKEMLERYRADFFDQDEFCKATNYILSAWKEFTAFIDEVQIPLSNNDAERALRHAVLGRKNFNGSKTINGADVAATLYTVIESAKKLKLDPIDYMKYVITENQSDCKPLTPLAYAKKLRGQ